MSDSEDSVQCRSCLSTTATEYIHMESSMVGEYSYMECFNICTNLNAILDEGLPDYICDKCSQDLQVSFDFVNEARMADAALRKNLPIQKQQIAPITLDEKEYVWTEEDEVNLQKDDVFENTQMEFMDDDDVEEYQDLETCEDDLILEDVKIEDEQGNQLESMEEFVKEEAEEGLSPFEAFSEDEQNDEEEEESKDCYENDEEVKNFDDNLTTTKKGKVYKERNYTCIVCGKGYEYNVNLRNHMRVVHKEEFKKQIKEPEMESVRCEECKKLFLRKNIEKHMLKHARDKEKESTTEQTLLLCAFCPKKFKTRTNLQSHEKLHNPSRIRNYACEYCEMRFYKIQTKINHVKFIHLNCTDRPHVCPVCGKNYKEKSGLSTHFKVHLSKRFECTQCGKKYPRVNELTIHMRTHTGETPYKCHLCDQSFRIKNRLTIHLQNHLGAKHKCKVCHALFDSRLKLRHHKYEHTGLPYRCEQCPDAQYSRRIRLRNHIKSHHKRTPSEEELTANFLRNKNKNLLPEEQFVKLNNIEDIKII